MDREGEMMFYAEDLSSSRTERLGGGQLCAACLHALRLSVWCRCRCREAEDMSEKGSGWQCGRLQAAGCWGQVEYQVLGMAISDSCFRSFDKHPSDAGSHSGFS